MLIIFEGMLPVFLMIAAGILLKRLEIMPEVSWKGLNRLGFYFLMPVLLFHILYKTNFSSISAGPLSLTFLIGLLIVLVGGLLIRTPLQSLLSLDGPSYSSLYQSVGRWNGFIALAVVEKLFGSDGLTIVAVALVVLIVPINIFNIAVVSWLGKSDSPHGRSFTHRLITNPLVIGAVAGIFFNLLAVPVYQPVLATLELISRATLPIGLLLIGVGLKFEFTMSDFATCTTSVLGKLLILPLIYILLATWFGITGNTLLVIAICGAVPTAMSGYLMASQMGGNAPLLATIVTLQTVVSFFTIPLMLEVARMLGN